MSSITLLPDEMIIEIMLKLQNCNDYMSILSTCKRIFGLKQCLAKIQIETKMKIQSILQYKNNFGRAIVFSNVKEAIVAAFHTKPYDTMAALYDKRIKKLSSNAKLQDLYKMAGNVVTFRRWVSDNDGNWKYPNKKYISIHFSWVTNEIIWIKMYDEEKYQKIRFYAAEDRTIMVDRSEFINMCWILNREPELREFPGELLRRALNAV